jgi:hypothetical protein
MIKKLRDLDLQYNLQVKKRADQLQDLDQKVIIKDAEAGILKIIIKLFFFKFII